MHKPLSMIEGKDIICFSNDWDGDPLSKKHVMLRFAKHNRVLWINSIGNRKPTASVYDLKRIVTKLRDFARGHRQVHEQIYVFRLWPSRSSEAAWPAG